MDPGAEVYLIASSSVGTGAGGAGVGAPTDEIHFLVLRRGVWVPVVVQLESCDGVDQYGNEVTDPDPNRAVV